MYGQKQILQCLCVAIMLTIFSFHRSAINRNKEIKNRKFVRDQRIKKTTDQIVQINNKNSEIDQIQNISGYCLKNPFGLNIYANHDPHLFCFAICFDKFDTWLRKQCEANCCVCKSSKTNIGIRVKSVRKPVPSRPQTTRSCENALMDFIKNSARSHNTQCESVIRIIEPIDKRFIDRTVSIRSTSNN